MTTIHAPVEGYTGVGYYGAFTLEFRDGQADYDGELPEAVVSYLESNGYGIGSAAAEPETPPEPADPRDVQAVEQVGSTLRDAAVDPQPEDFLPPSNAGEANPHGSDVVSPGIHGIESRAIVPGEVAELDVQEERETEQVDRILSDDEPVPEVTADLAESADEERTEAADAADPDAPTAGLADTIPEALEQPKGNASHAAWIDYAVSQGTDRAVAEGMSRDELREQFTA